MAVCNVIGNVLDPSGSAVVSANIRFNSVLPQIIGSSEVMPSEVKTTTDSSGNFNIQLVQTISGMITIEYPPTATDSPRRYVYSVIVPAVTTANITTLITES